MIHDRLTFFVENVVVLVVLPGDVFVHRVHLLVHLNLRNYAHRVLVAERVALTSMSAI